MDILTAKQKFHSLTQLVDDVLFYLSAVSVRNIKQYAKISTDLKTYSEKTLGFQPIDGRTALVNHTKLKMT